MNGKLKPLRRKDVPAVDKLLQTRGELKQEESVFTAGRGGVGVYCWHRRGRC